MHLRLLEIRRQRFKRLVVYKLLASAAHSCILSPMKHENDGYCEKCHQIINRYPGLYTPLLEWFKFFQKNHPEAHISCAGRGEADQNHAYDSGTSRAHWTESAHNWNAALDFFVAKKGLNIYDKQWFELVLGSMIPEFLEWYGKPGSEFYELPHVQLKNWKAYRDSGHLRLVQYSEFYQVHGNGD